MSLKSKTPISEAISAFMQWPRNTDNIYLFIHHSPVHLAIIYPMREEEAELGGHPSQDSSLCSLTWKHLPITLLHVSSIF